jgi:hypothetical protein
MSTLDTALNVIREYAERICARHPGTPEAGVAESFLRALAVVANDRATIDDKATDAAQDARPPPVANVIKLDPSRRGKKGRC